MVREREREWLLRVSGKEKKMGFITIMPPVVYLFESKM